MLQLRRDMFEAAREQNVMTGTVRIGVAETIVQTWLPTLIELIHTTYPALVLEIEVDTTHVLRSHLMSRQIDLAFLMGPVLAARVACCARSPASSAAWGVWAVRRRQAAWAACWRR
ncbi:hypothetical protein G6F57_021868 [Rhizopus arrhizus]|nr:hypothetical protein G6F57_021868 [Rhizopus arrhizus]